MCSQNCEAMSGISIVWAVKSLQDSNNENELIIPLNTANTAIFAQMTPATVYVSVTFVCPHPERISF